MEVGDCEKNTARGRDDQRWRRDGHPYDIDFARRRCGEYELVYLVPYDQDKELHGIGAKQIRTFSRTGRNVPSLLRFAWRLTQVMLKEKPDVVHLHSTFSGVIGRCVCVLLRPWRKPKIVYCPHAFSFLMESSPIKQKVYAWIERVLQKVTDVIICVSQYELDKAARFGIERKRMKLIYNGIHHKDDAQKAARARADSSAVRRSPRLSERLRCAAQGVRQSRSATT